MKKSLLIIIALAFGLAAANAQDIVSKKGEKYLPEAGDWGLGVDANPFLNYLGNFFGKSNNNTAPSFLFPNAGFMIQGKYYADATMAYRAGVRIGLNSSSTTNTVADRSSTTNPTFPALPALVDNKWKTSNTHIGLTGGIEKHMGTTRLQGYYGAEAGIGLSSSSSKFTYGNALNPTGTPAVVIDQDDAFASANNLTQDTYGNEARITESKGGTTFSFGVRGFIGVQYFILPKISLGGELGWGLLISTSGKSSTTTESINGTTLGTQTIETGGGSSISLDTDNKNMSLFGNVASLVLIFHFH